MLIVKRNGEFDQTLRTLYLKDPQLRPIVRKCIHWFQHNPDDTRLRNHKLHNRLKGKWAFSITSNIRIIYEWIGKKTVRFLMIGPHNQVYPKH